MGQGFSAGDFGTSESVENAGILYVFSISGDPIKGNGPLWGEEQPKHSRNFPLVPRGPHKASMLYGERRNPGTAGIFRLRKMEHCAWYSHEELCVWCFDDLHDWGKRSAEHRSPHCAVLP